MGTTSRRSSSGKAALAASLVALALFAIVEGSSWIGGLILAVTIVAVVAWAIAHAAARGGRAD